ncbi:hypothetical protein [Streptomyces atratus]|uniref:hypothetical protein n=1 Tax=Streptomyces atratus TaxID=1893 RepID=UPI0033E76F4D
MEVVRNAEHRFEVGAATGVFALTGSAAGVARNLVALEDGYGPHIVSRNTQLTPGEAQRLILGYARAATGRAEL